MSDSVAERIAQFLDEHHVMTLATSCMARPRDDGGSAAHATSLFYARDGLSLIWVSEARTRHSRDLGKDRRAAVTIAPDTADFDAICGIQAHGWAECVTDEPERSRLLAILVGRYPFLAHADRASSRMADDLAKAHIYRLNPRRMVLIDNRIAFGHKDVLDLTD